MKRKIFKQFFAAGLSCAMVVSSLGVCGVTTRAELTTEQMVASSIYNLALYKTATANPTKGEGSESVLTDGKFTPKGDHAATTFGTAQTYYLVDLGKGYEASGIDQIVVGYKEKNNDDTPVKGYKIQYSTDGFHFTDVKTVSGAEVSSTITEDNLIDIQDVSGASGIVRYVKLFYPDSYRYGVQATEIAVLDIDGDVQEAEIPKCADAAAVSVTSPEYNTMEYQIVAGENQEEYLYLVYLDEKKLVGNGVSAGVSYTVEDVDNGYHSLKVVAVYGGGISDGILSSSVMVHDPVELITDKKNVASKKNNPKASVKEASSYDVSEGVHTLATAQVLVDGETSSGQGNDKALRTNRDEGSPQSFVVDLGQYYTASECESALIAYTNSNTCASDTKIAFSKDGIHYTEVGGSTGYTCRKQNTGTVDVNVVPLNKLEDYEGEAVRFVKVTLSGGVYTWGYVINEFGLMVNTETPALIESEAENPADVSVTEGFGKLQYTITAAEGQDETSHYIVNIDGETVNDSAVAGETYTVENLAAGTRSLVVYTSYNDWISSGVAKSVNVDGYVNYIKDSLNLVFKDSHPEVTVTCDSDNRNYDNPNSGLVPGSQGIGAVLDAIRNGVYTDLAHHTGYLQTRPDREDANIIYDLGEDYNPTDIHSLIAVYSSANNAATEYEISFSATGEEDSYERVFYAKNVIYRQFLEDVVDVSAYTQETVRFIKYSIITGNYQAHTETCKGGCNGYNLCELAVMGDISLKPETPKNVTAVAPEYNTVTVTWDDIDNPNATYKIYIDTSLYGFDIPAGEGEKTFQNIRQGTHTVKVFSVYDGMESIAAQTTVQVETEPTTAKPTTKPEPTTAKQTERTETTQPAYEQTGEKQTVTGTVQSTVGKTKVKKAKAGRKKVSLTLKKVTGAAGYRIKYATNKKFKKAGTVTAKKNKVTIRKLKRGKKYYFKAQAYILVDGNKKYGAWSSVKKSKKVK